MSDLAHSTDLLPDVISYNGDGHAATASRGWTIQDIVEVRRITGIAISGSGQHVAFLVEESFIGSGTTRYGLYLAEKNSHRARKIVEASYLSQLYARPGTENWTVRADIGVGVQLYEIDASANIRSLIVNPSTVMVGTYESAVEAGSKGGPHETGVASYEWAPDGDSFWYARYVMKSSADRVTRLEKGIRYDDHTMDRHIFLNDSVEVLGTELRVVRRKDLRDRSLVVLPATLAAGVLFNREAHTALWESDSEHIRYLVRGSNADGSAEASAWSIDIRTGTAARLPGDSVQQFYSAIPCPGNSGYLRLSSDGPTRNLFRLDQNLRNAKDLGVVHFTSLGEGAWNKADGGKVILAVQYESRDGLATVPDSKVGTALAHVSENLSHCSFDPKSDYGACVRESLSLAPELVEVSLVDGRISTMVRPNASYQQIAALASAPFRSINRYGFGSDGFVTYPRNYVRGNKYPTILVTHADDARNRFAEDEFQWEFPIQVLAELGYVVLSANEPRSTEYAPGRALSSPLLDKQASDAQFRKAFNPVASMEAALQWAIDSGIADPERAGIAGYSRGAEVVEYVMTHSRMFKTAIEGDAGGYTAALYWSEGWAPTREMFKRLYGGSPYDPKALESYRTLSPSFRTDEFAGPMLQLYAEVNGASGLELNALLRDHDVPTELVVFPHENHIFWHPRRRAAAMQNSIDWLDYWLRDKRDQDISKNGQYARWDVMADKWHRRPQ